LVLLDLGSILALPAPSASETPSQILHDGETKVGGAIVAGWLTLKIAAAPVGISSDNGKRVFDARSGRLARDLS